MAISQYLKRLRRAVGHDILLVPSASVVIRDESGRVLLQQRVDDGGWSLPGGAMDPGESMAQAAIREAHEETGLDIELVGLIGVYSDASQTRTYPNGDRVQPMVVLFEGRVLSGTLRPDSQETLQLAYFSPEALPENLPGQHRIPPILDAIANRSEAFFR